MYLHNLPILKLFTDYLILGIQLVKKDSTPLQHLIIEELWELC